MTPNTESLTPEAPIAATLSETAAGWMGAFAAFRRGFAALPDNRIFAAIYGVFGVVLTTLAHYQPNNAAAIFTIIMLTSLVFQIALIKYALATAKGTVLSVGQLFETTTSQYSRVLGTYLLVGAAVIMSAFLLFIPLFWLIPWTYLMTYIIINEDLDLRGAFRRSKELTKGNYGKIVGIVGVTFLYLMGSIVVSGVPIVGWIVGEIMSVAIGLAGGTAVASLYLYLREHSGVK